MASPASHIYDTYAVIDLNAYSANIRSIIAHTGPDVLLMAVVKANAYGHGIIPCSRAAVSAGAAMLGVAFSTEGEVIRRAGITAPILVMCQESYDRLPVLLENNLTISLSSLEMLAAVKKECAFSGVSADVHINVDTGMGRSGVQPCGTEELTAAAMDTPGVTVTGLYSHFSSSEEKNNSFARRQIDTFNQVIGHLENRGIKPDIVHMCNSAGVLNYPEAHFDMVRPGLMTYGLLPFPGSAGIIPVEQVLSLKSRISFIKDVPAGFPVSYGAAFVTSRPSRLATVPIGYGHGFRRHNSNRGEALAGGTKIPVAGRVCMDQTVFDITDAGDVNTGDIVTLIGKDGGRKITAEDHARIADTINYEIVTGITDRVPRIIESS